MFQAELLLASAGLPFTGDSVILTRDNLDEVSHMF